MIKQEQSMSIINYTSHSLLFVKGRGNTSTPLLNIAGWHHSPWLLTGNKLTKCVFTSRVSSEKVFNNVKLVSIVFWCSRDKLTLHCPGSRQRGVTCTAAGRDNLDQYQGDRRERWGHSERLCGKYFVRRNHTRYPALLVINITQKDFYIEFLPLIQKYSYKSNFQKSTCFTSFYS